MSNQDTSEEKFYFYNSLAILLKAVEGERTTVDLRNEASIYGTIEQADGYMNIVIKDCIFTDPRGDKFPYEIFFVHARNIRYVHIPPNIPIIPAITNQLRNLSKNPNKTNKMTFKSKRTQQNQMEGRAAVDRILKGRSSKPESEITEGNR
ncbi:U7 snRNA-associated Sm-like protein LSm10 isoform X2 [Venturia canescens]|uniref:U7 snRNA-associated Sm-like protein LSm10 isoform X2 n=1 Tax=Venturia canescens TaxID=32260 RepID=UPI001C9C49BA|nr:U7 snRNA-associated Sm-like protein LSm10 isoform X2 [Venturia canescens]